MSDNFTKKMLSKIREQRDKLISEKEKEFIIEEKEDDNFLNRAKILMSEAVDMAKKKDLNESEGGKEFFVIKRNTPQFGDVRTSQEDMIRKTISDNISLDEDALKFYPNVGGSQTDDITLSGKIPSLNLSFQFRYQDTSGDGCYIWAESLQLTETNARTIGKIRDAFSNWKDSITQDGDLMARLKEASAQK